jgi:hypothetical protein
MSGPNLNIIPFSTIQEALEIAEVTDRETTKFNTYFHTHAEIAAAIPEPEDSPAKHLYPDLSTGNFSNWISLIASSQDFHLWHEFTLPNSFVQELLDANVIWALTGKAIGDDTMEDLLARSPKRTSQGIATEAVFDGQREWFLRLDFCSTKDARGRGGEKYSSAIRTVGDALQRISASKRAARALEHILLEKAPGPARLFFIPYNKHMDTSREFRVFCPPVWSLTGLLDKRNHRGEAAPRVHTTDEQAVGCVLPREYALPSCSSDHVEQNEARVTDSNDAKPAYLHQQDGDKHSLGRITAISQYRWHAPYHRPSLTSAQVDAAKALTAAQSIHAQIISHAASLESLPDSTGVLQKLLSEGFVFDIFEAPNGEMQLLEINPFGAMSGCGSCLFHWIEDARVMYGKQERVEMRLAM